MRPGSILHMYTNLLKTAHSLVQSFLFNCLFATISVGFFRSFTFGFSYFLESVAQVTAADDDDNDDDDDEATLFFQALLDDADMRSPENYKSQSFSNYHSRLLLLLLLYSNQLENQMPPHSAVGDRHHLPLTHQMCHVIFCAIITATAFTSCSSQITNQIPEPDDFVIAFDTRGGPIVSGLVDNMLIRASANRTSANLILGKR